MNLYKVHMSSILYVDEICVFMISIAIVSVSKVRSAQLLTTITN